MDRLEIEKKFRSIKVWARGDQKAPHKPLLLLVMLARYARGGDRLVEYSAIEQQLRDLIGRFGPARGSIHPEYPFWRLQGDGIWEIESAHDLKRRKGQSDVLRSELINHRVRGGLTVETHRMLIGDPGLIERLAVALLERNFPASVHGDIRSAVGLT